MTSFNFSVQKESHHDHSENKKLRFHEISTFSDSENHLQQFFDERLCNQFIKLLKVQYF